VPCDQQIAGFTAKPIADPVRLILRLEITCGRELSERIARAPERFRRFLRAQLAAVPDDGRLDAAGGGLRRETLDGLASPRRQWPARIDLRADRVAMMNQDKSHPANPALPVRILAVLLLLWQPFNVAYVMSGLIDELSVRGSGLAIILLARLLAAGLGIAAGLALFQRRPGGVTLAKTSLLFSAIVDIVAYATPFVPDNRPPGDATIILVASLAYYAGWFIYLIRATSLESP